MEASFWKASGLKRFREWFREDDGQSLTPGQVTAAQNAIHLIQTEPFGTAIYDAMEVLVEAGWSNAADVYDVEAVLSDQAVPAWAYAATKGNAKQLAYLVVERERAGLSALLEQAVANGSTAKDFAKDIQSYFAEGYHVLAPDGVHGFDGSNVIRKMATKPWSVTVARTELSRASNFGQMAFYHAAGIAQVEWSATLGVACCDECSDADGEVVNLGESFPFVDVDAPPAHPRCCPPGTMIVTDRGLRPIETIKVGDRVLTHRLRFQRVLRRTSNVVAEDLIELRVGPNVLRVTGNHPVYTIDGWAAAATLKPGDEVACVHLEAMIGASSKSKYIPAQCPNCGLLHLVLREFASALVPVPAVNLDREHVTWNGDVDSEGVDRKVGDRGKARFEQRIKNDSLVPALDSVRHRSRAEDALAVGTGSAARGYVSGFSDPLTLLGARLAEAQRHRLAKVSPRQSEALESVGNDASAADRSEFVDRELENGFAGEVPSVERSDLVVGKHARWHGSILRISSATRVAYRGTVYNFAVQNDESYVAEGVVVHNCVCSTIPADADLGDMDISDEQRARAARGGYSAEDYEAKFGEKHPIDGGKKSRTIYGDDGGDDE